jgi:uncharacterized membrane protein
MTLTDVVAHVAEAFDAVGTAILVLGFLWSLAVAGRSWRAGRGPGGGAPTAYQELRQSFGRVLLLGLEVLVAADLIRTVAVAPTLGNVVVLAIIVAIRTFLSFSLEVEIGGTLPWRRPPSSAQGAGSGTT